MKINRHSVIFGVFLAAVSAICLGEIIDEEPEVVRKVKPSKSGSPTENKGEQSSEDQKTEIAPKSQQKSPQIKSGDSVPASKAQKGSSTSTNTSTKKGSLPPVKSDKPKQNLPVHFESKGLKGLREKGLVELIEDVIVTQGDFRLEAANARVFFHEASHEVQKVIAEGQVKITNIDETTGEKMEAFGNQVLFNNMDRKVVLEGNARVKRGDSSVIRGKKITYEMDTGWIKADKVAGELTPSDNGGSK